MRYRKDAGKIHLVLDVGEEVIASLIELARAERFASATFTGIGALGDVTLGYFDVREKKYLRGEFAGSHELVSLTGSIAWDGDEPVVHAHACLAGPDFAPRAGHLFKGTVTVTGEIFLHLNTTRLTRSIDGTFGLKLLDIGKGPRD